MERVPPLTAPASYPILQPAASAPGPERAPFPAMRHAAPDPAPPSTGASASGPGRVLAFSPARAALGTPASLLPLPPRPPPPRSAAPRERPDPAAAREASRADVAAWAAEAPPDERVARREAARRIDAFIDQAANGTLALDLKHLGLRSLPDLRCCRYCTALDLDGNLLSSLPALPERLATLSAAGNHLCRLPRLPGSLLTLNLSGNRLAALPPLPAGLEALDAADNRLERLPPLPRSLEQLIVRNNRLAALPDLSEHRFRRLDLAHNRLTDLPHAIGEHARDRIDMLDLSGNPWRPDALERIRLLTRRETPPPCVVMRDLGTQLARHLADAAGEAPATPSLPDDTLLAVFGQVDARTTGALRAAGRAFKALADETVATARLKNIGDLPKWLAAFPEVRQIDLIAGEARGDELRMLKDFPKLHALRIDLDGLQDPHLAHLGRLAQLETLDIVGRHGISDTGVANLRGLTSLQSLRLQECTAITDGCLGTLARLPNLRHLHVFYCQSMQFDALPGLEGMPALRSLSLHYNHARASRLLGPTQFPLLERIELTGARVSAEAFAAFAQAPRPALRWLCINDCPSLPESAFANLSGLSGLQVLDLHGTRVANAPFHALPGLRQLNLGNGQPILATTLACIGGLTHLKELTGAGSPQLTDECAAHLGRLERLERLDLQASPHLGNAGLGMIAQNRRLKYLRLTGNDRIDAEGIAHLATLPQLRELDLANCQTLNDAAILQLESLTRLEKLNLTGCRNVSYAGRCALRERRPALEIISTQVRPTRRS